MTTYSVWGPPEGTRGAGVRSSHLDIVDARMAAVQLAEEYARLCWRVGAVPMAASNAVLVYATGITAPVYSVRTYACDDCGRPELADAGPDGMPALFALAYDDAGRPLCRACERERDPAGPAALMPDEATA